ncbi:MAG TPA: NADP-dependent oxidoreductase [Verrucomicrobiae bacterium]|nr:NADP-dependent oxidoreductase [Verrucomicrobiae bacterium]
MATQLPKAMQAAVINEFGGPDVIHLQTLPVPQIAADEVLIKVKAAGVAAWDALEREGKYDEAFGMPTVFPYALGWDGAGEIAAVGANVQGFKEGDKVYSASMPLPRGGFYAEYKAVAAEHVAHIPQKITMEQAAAMPWCALTALSGLDRLSLKQGETLMILGASGGIGHIAVQLAKRMGVKVFAVASGADGVALATQLGADMAIDGLNDDIVAAAQQFTPGGVDAALALFGGKTTNVALEAVRSGGRVARPDAEWPDPYVKQGVELLKYNGDTTRRATDRLNTLIESGPFTVHIDKAFPFEQVVAAHEALDAHFIGKIVLTITN